MNRTYRAAIAILAGITAFEMNLRAVVAVEDPPETEPATAAIRREAEAVGGFVKSGVAKEFLRAAALLPGRESCVVYRNADRTKCYSAEEYAKLSDSDRAGLEERKLDEKFYYTTRYGTPVAYARAIDLIGGAGFTDAKGKRILDFGYGGIGHLRMLASLGADVVGVEVDPMLPVLYGRPGDQGKIEGHGGVAGTLRLVHGRWPAEAEVKTAVGGRYDLIISKNTLKNGYIHPAQKVDEQMLVKLGVDDEAFVRAVYESLNPGGLFMIYNLSPAPAPPDKPYIPWSDGHCPFARAILESAGFEVLNYDEDDSTAAREMGHLLGWDQREQGMDLQNDLFGHFTLVRKPAGSK